MPSAQSAIAAAGLAAAELWRRRTGRAQTVAVDMRHAAVEFRSERHIRLAGKPPGPSWDKIAGVYRTGDGRHVRLHTNFPHHRDGILALLNCTYDREAVQAALLKWEGAKFETAAAEAGLVATLYRSTAEWQAHPQGIAVAGCPCSKSRGSAKPPRARCRAHLRIARSLACACSISPASLPARFAAARSRPTAPMSCASRRRICPSQPMLDTDTGRGKLSAALDLRPPDDRERLATLLREAHVFVQGYRPGGIAGLGFSPQACAEIRPGIVAVTLSAYGREGPWALRRGFDSLVQNATGINHAEAEVAGVPGPKELPAQALDHASGYLMAFGAMMALARKEREGGSWHVRVSLAQTGHWLAGLGRLPAGFDCPDIGHDDIADLLGEMDTPRGRLTFVKHAARLSATPADLGPSPAGARYAARRSGRCSDHPRPQALANPCCILAKTGASPGASIKAHAR